MKPKGIQNLCKIASKIDAKINAEKVSENEAKMNQNWCRNDAKTDTKFFLFEKLWFCENLAFTIVKTRFSQNHDFSKRIHFVSVLVSFLHQFWFILASFSDTFSALIFASIFEMILHRFWMPFGSILDPFWYHFGHPKSTLALVSVLGTILMHFWWILSTFWHPLASFWRPLAHFWRPLASFGSLLVLFWRSLVPFLQPFRNNASFWSTFAPFCTFPTFRMKQFPASSSTLTINLWCYQGVGG